MPGRRPILPPTKSLDQEAKCVASTGHAGHSPPQRALVTPKRAARRVRSRQLSPSGGEKAPKAAGHPRAKCLDTSALPTLVHQTRATPTPRRGPSQVPPQLPLTAWPSSKDGPCQLASGRILGTSLDEAGAWSLQVPPEAAARWDWGGPRPEAVPFGLGPHPRTWAPHLPKQPWLLLSRSRAGWARHHPEQRRQQHYCRHHVCAPDLSQDPGAERDDGIAWFEPQLPPVRKGGAKKEGRLPQAHMAQTGQ